MKKLATRVPLVLLVIALSTFVLLLGMNQRPGFHVSLPTMAFEPPPVEVTAAPTQPEEQVEQEEGEGGDSKVLFAILLLLAILLLAYGARRALRMLGSPKSRDVEIPAESELDDSPDLTEILIPKVAVAIDAGLYQLANGTSPRNGVIAAWHALEMAVEESGVERSPAHTPTEFTLSALDQLELDKPQLQSLLALFHRARFTEHEVTAQDTAQAADILRALRTQLMELDAKKFAVRSDSSTGTELESESEPGLSTQSGAKS